MAVAAIFDLYIHLYSLEEDVGLPTKAYPWCVTHVKKFVMMGQVHCESKHALDPFSFEHNFGKYCPISIILSLLQTEINFDQGTLKFATIPQIC